MIRIKTITGSQSRLMGETFVRDTGHVDHGHRLLREEEARNAGKLEICCRNSLSVEEDLEPSENSFSFL